MPSGTVETMLTPGAPMSTVVAPKLEKPARSPFDWIAATAITQSQPRVALFVHW
ncbi:unannotated protein [freshwater metagenome]|uniref:Unannotated protein n=1 Tax=freshwater metagenome TaxID=449393 RepID=A0A6J7NIX6_9ZZZZ